MAQGDDNQNELGALSEQLAPVMTSGANWEDVLASGDPSRYLAAIRSGAPPAQVKAPSLLPATNAPNPPSEAPRPQAIPAAVSPRGAPTTATPPSGAATPAASAFARPDPNAIESQLVSATAPQSATNPQGVPIVRDPNHPEYKPGVGRRIVRGLVAAGEGLAEGGLRGALLGSLDPSAVGATAYGAGTRPFQQAAQRNQMLQDSLKQQLGQSATNAETGLKEVQTEAGRLIQVSPAQAQAMGNPALAGTSITQKSLDDLIRNSNTVQGRKDVAGINADAKRDVADANNLTKEHLATLKPEQRDDRAIRLLAKPPAERTQEENAYLGGYARWVDATRTQPGVARAEAFARYRPVQTIDGDGNVHYEYAGNAIAGGASAPASIPFRTAQSVAKAFTSGPQAGQLTAFRTATDHLALMRQAADALHNGDVQAINRLGNAFQTQLGKAAPTNAKALAEMLSGELASVLSKGGATVSEIDEMRKQINANAQSPEQMSGIIDTNQNVINEKANELLQQYVAGEQGQPVFAPLSQSGTNPVQLPTAPGRFSTRTPSAPKAPSVGTVENGFRFKGGDASKKANWEAVKK